MRKAKEHIVAVVDTNILNRAQSNPESKESKCIEDGITICWRFFFSAAIWKEWRGVLSSRRITPERTKLFIMMDEAGKLKKEPGGYLPTNVEKSFRRFRGRGKKSHLINDRKYLELLCRLRKDHPDSKIIFLTGDPHWRGFNSSIGKMKLNIQFIDPSRDSWK